MKYVVFHLLTGGLNPYEHSILEIGAIIEDTETKLPLDKIPKFQSLINYDIYKGDPFALYQNRELLKQLSEKGKKTSKQFLALDVVAVTLHSWLSKFITTTLNDSNYMLDFNAYNHYDAEGAMEYEKHKTLLINVAGKNFGVFQHRFLQQIPEINDYISFNHRFMDPAILFFDPQKDNILPGTNECKIRAGLNIIEDHIPDTISECWDVILMFRQKLNY